MNVGVIGAGYVGTTVAACLAEMGHQVTCVERDPGRLAALQEGRPPFHEPGLADLLHRQLTRRLRLVADLAAVRDDEVVFVAVGTPPGPGGEPDLSAVDEVVDTLAALSFGGVLALKSTVPVGTTARLERELRRRGLLTAVACNPEFLREGSAVRDFFRPFRIVIGSHSARAVAVLRALYEQLDCPILVTDPATAEMIKHASNAFLATKVSFVNEIAALCEAVGVDVAAVAEGMGLDPRIGPHYLRAGIGFGGSCLPKDLRALVSTARARGVRPALLESVMEVNATQPARFAERVDRLVGGLAGKAVAVLGLAFKGGTSDVRESPALAVVRALLNRGAVVRAFDPAAEAEAARAVPAMVCCPTPYEAARGAEAVLILTDWPQFEVLDWERMGSLVGRRMVVDGRGLAGVRRAADHGFTYVGPSTPVPEAEVAVPAAARVDGGGS
ncbi:MAG: UDP-glucose/GDP-mannose dehydrogenase family protein [Armatimonadota bacterium]|nr:UDP-glucose/GDP-mannose dehydrogenase family protein [Armatimonadota bacterium]